MFYLETIVFMKTVHKHSNTVVWRYIFIGKIVYYLLFSQYGCEVLANVKETPIILVNLINYSTF